MRVLAKRLPLGSLLEGPKRLYENLSAREQKLVFIGGIFILVLGIVLPIWLVRHQTRLLRDENEETLRVLGELQSREGQLREAQALRQAVQDRYTRKAPLLGSFLDELAKRNGLTLKEIINQPDKAIGGFTRKHVRLKLPGVPLKPVIDFLTSIENSGYPVAIINLSIEHFKEGDSYNVEFEVAAYEGSVSAERTRSTTTTRRRRTP